MFISLEELQSAKEATLAQPNAARIDIDLLSLQFTPQELQAFLEAYKGQVDSVHEDTRSASLKWSARHPGA